MLHILDVDMMIYSGLGLPVNLNKYYRTSVVTQPTQAPVPRDLAGPVNQRGIVRMLRSDPMQNAKDNMGMLRMLRSEEGRIRMLRSDPSVTKREVADADMGMIRMLRSDPNSKRGSEMGMIRMLRSDPNSKRGSDVGMIRMLRSDPNSKRDAEMGRIRMLRSDPSFIKRSNAVEDGMGRIRML